MCKSRLVSFDLVRRSASYIIVSTGILFAIANAVSSPKGAQANSDFLGLGDLPGGASASVAWSISADGTVVVGWATSANGTEAFRWSEDDGIVGLGAVGAGFLSRARDVNSNGSVIVGTTGSFGGQAFYWSDANGVVGLGHLPGGGGYSEAVGVNYDGSVVVGFSDSFNGTQEAFVWTSTTGMVGIGDLPGGAFESYAEDVNFDGTVVVGGSQSHSGMEAFRWTQSGGMQGLGDLPGGLFGSFAYGVNYDGTVIVGVGRSSIGSYEAFRWTEAGGMVGLGDLAGGPYASLAYDVSDDGSVVVGFGATARGVEAFRWLEGTGEGSGMRSLASLLSEGGVELGTWILREAIGVSGDGRVIVGWGTNPNGGQEAFRAIVGIGLLTFNDFVTSLSSMSDAAMSANGLAQAHLALTMHGGYMNADHGFDPDAIGSLRQGDTLTWTSMHEPRDEFVGTYYDPSRYGRIAYAAEDFLAERPELLNASFGFAHQATKDLQLQVNFHRGDYSLRIAGNDDWSGRSSFGLNSYSAYEPKHSPLRIYTGVTANWLSDDLGRGYENGVTPVESRGERNGSTFGGAVVAGWQLPLTDKTSLMPFAEYNLTSLSLDGYSEAQGPFPAVFDDVQKTDQVAKLGAEVTTTLFEKVNLMGSLAYTRQLDEQPLIVSGHIPVLGSDFAFGGERARQDWMELQLGLNGYLSERLRFNAFIDAAADGEEISLGGIIGFRIEL